MEDYSLTCTCESVQFTISGTPITTGHCHCGDCRLLLHTPYHSVSAWNPDQLTVTQGEENLTIYQHPSLRMKKAFCATCGDVVYNTNAMDWRVVSLNFIARNYNWNLPQELSPQSHFFYDRRIVSVADDLPKRP